MNTNPNDAGDFDITIFGQPVIDHVIDLKDPFRYGELMNIVKETNQRGELIFKERSWIRTFENEEQYFFGMPLIYPGDQLSLGLIPGRKPVVAHLERHGVIAPRDLVAHLGKPIVNIGGGGPNVFKALNQVFGKFSIEFIGAYCPIPGLAGPVDDPTIDSSIRFSLEAVSTVLKGESHQPKRSLKVAPIYNTVPVNIVIEGMRGKKGPDRGVLKSPFSEKIINRAFNPEGKAIMVNTVYSKTLAVNALSCAIDQGRLGVIALTESLCDDQSSFSAEEKEWISLFLKSRNMNIDFDKTKTLYDFILDTIIPHGPKVLIMNETEFDHILNPKRGDISKPHPVTGQKRVSIVEGDLLYLDSLLEGFQAIRNLQKEERSRLYVTVGVHGSFCLDEENIVHYSPVTEVEGIAPRGKNAIGDTYAAMVLAGEYISRYKRVVRTPYILSSAAAAADALYYSGFEGVSPAIIDEYLAKTFTSYPDEGERGNYIELGPLSELPPLLGSLPFPGAPHIRLSDIQRKDWFNTIRRNAPKMQAHYPLTEQYSVEFLTLHRPNGTIG